MCQAQFRGARDGVVNKTRKVLLSVISVMYHITPDHNAYNNKSLTISQFLWARNSDRAEWGWFYIAWGLSCQTRLGGLKSSTFKVLTHTPGSCCLSIKWASSGLLGGPHDMEAGFPQSKWCKRKWGRQALSFLWPSLRSHLASLPPPSVPSQWLSLDPLSRTVGRIRHHFFFFLRHHLL